MFEFVYNVMALLGPVFGIGVAKGRGIVSHHQHLFNFPWADEVMPQSVQKLQPPCTVHVVREGEVFLGNFLRRCESSIFLVRLHLPIIHCWDEAFLPKSLVWMQYLLGIGWQSR